MLRSTLFVTARRHLSSRIPFDTKPFPYQRFEPCCPGTKTEANGFISCQQHPIPTVLGKKIELNEPMQRPEGLRHLVGCVGYHAPEWSASHCESTGILNSIIQSKQHWLKSNVESQRHKQVLFTVAEREPSVSDCSDIMIFPEFKILPAIDSHQLQHSPLYPVLDSIWKDPTTPLKLPKEWQDIQADTVVLVCTHARRDMRCGYLGPPLVEEFNKQAKELGLKLEAWGTSHFGGHKFAGNVIIHQRGLGGHVYGNVRACHVKDIIDRHVIHGKVIKELWRGQATAFEL